MTYPAQHRGADMADNTVTFSRQAVPKRYILVALCFAATFICYIDRVNISVAIIPMAEEFGWTDTTKGIVLSSFFIGYMAAMIPSGWLANRIGGRLLLGGALVLWSLFTFMTPVAAAISLGVLVTTRIVMGAGEAATFPAVYNMFARWLPATERSRAVAINLAGVPLGTVFALSASGALIAAFGWQSVFYAFGGAGIVFAVVWFRLAHKSPTEHPSISASERRLLDACITDEKGKAVAIPWRLLFSKSAVWALIINHFCSNWSLYLMLTWLPSYFRDVQQLSISNAGLFSIAPWIVLFVAGNVSGLLADRLIGRGASLTRVRKSMQIIGLLGSSGFLLLASQPMTPVTALLTLCGALGMLGFCWAGFAPNHLDIGPRHADVLYSLSNTAGTIPGIIGVAATGWLLDVTGDYTATFLLAAGVNVAGAVVWYIWGTGKRVID